MRRCIELAMLGIGNVRPNPAVGAVLVHNNTIIGEGYHEQYGQAHAEVNCIRSIKDEHKALIPYSTLYVSLEPCAHHGKTPPCSSLIIAEKIKTVVIGCLDPFTAVNGKGVQKLKAAGVEVVINVLQDECMELNKRFFCFHKLHRPYILLKWAQSDNHCMANGDLSRVFISNDYTNRLVHRWRSEEAAILTGTNTTLYDNPALTTRYWKGKHPLRTILDMRLRVPETHAVFNNIAPTVVFNGIKDDKKNNITFIKLNTDTELLPQVCDCLYKKNIQSLMIEGGAKLLQSFIDAGLWDEASIITNKKLFIDNGLQAPLLKNAVITGCYDVDTDAITFYNRI